jgi:hypothetical protein
VQWYRSLGIQNGTINIDLDRSEGAAGDTYSAWGSESNPNGTRLPYRQHETRKLNEKAGMATRMRHECDAQMSATAAHTLPEGTWRHECVTNAARMRHECGTNAARMRHECGTNAARMQHECGTNAARMRHECSTNAMHKSQRLSLTHGPRSHPVVMMCQMTHGVCDNSSGTVKANCTEGLQSRKMQNIEPKHSTIAGDTAQVWAAEDGAKKKG